MKGQGAETCLQSYLLVSLIECLEGLLDSTHESAKMFVFRGTPMQESWEKAEDPKASRKKDLGLKSRSKRDC